MVKTGVLNESIFKIILTKSLVKSAKVISILLTLVLLHACLEENNNICYEVYVYAVKITEEVSNRIKKLL